MTARYSAKRRRVDLKLLRQNSRVIGLAAHALWGVGLRLMQLSKQRVAAVFLACVLGPWVLLAAYAMTLSLPAELRALPTGQSTMVFDRNGGVLRQVRGPAGTLSQWAPLSEVPVALQEALVAVEDRHFFLHPGIDPLSILRASVQSLWTGRIVSGASTLTMQLARNLRPHRRNIVGKLSEMALALRIEASLNKTQILEAYLNRVDFGPNLRGIGAAAQGYFGKPVSALSLGESALLVGLPQSPTGYAYVRHRERALRRQSRVLTAVAQSNRIPASEIEVARREQLLQAFPRTTFGAPHFVSALMQGAFSSLQDGLSATDTRQAISIRSTIDPLLQRTCESAIAKVLEGLRDHQVSSASVLVVDNATGEVLAYVGSPNFYDDGNQGQVDGVRAKRQPGSTLKPFLYAAAFEELDYSAATVLPDLELSLETEAGPYTPRNFDDKFHGPVRLREALGNSLNVPAVHTAARLGASSLLAYLHRFGFESLNQAPEFYGPALALGDGEVTLLELVRGYLALARGGNAIALRVVTEVTTQANVQTDKASPAAPSTRRFPSSADAQVVPLAVASVITDILKDPAARQSSFGIDSALKFDFEVAAKTGTSKGYRDNWVVGYSSNVTVGVWVGNFDGRPMLKVGGVAGAAPIFHSILGVASSGQKPKLLALPRWEADEKLRLHYGVKRVEICPLSGELRGPHCAHGIFEHVSIKSELPTCQWHRVLELDRRNGKLAGPACPASVIHSGVFEVLPEKYRAWAQTTGRTLAPDGYSPNCEPMEVTPASDVLRITHPDSNSRFVIDPERDLSLQELLLEVHVPRTDGEIELLVDGKAEGKYRSPFVPRFRLRAGRHQLEIANAAGQKSAPIVIEVRASDVP